MKPQARVADRWTRRQLTWMGILLLLTAAAVYPFDLPITAWVEKTDLPGELERLIAFAEGFGNGLSVLLIIAVIAYVERSWRQFASLAIYAFGSGLLSDACKFFVARHRPYDGVDFQSKLDPSFIGWFPWLHGHAMEQSTSSFPSAHAATAAGLAFGLATFYPRGRYFFLIFAALTCCQRVACYAHFTSDVFAGAAVAAFLASLLVCPWSITSRLNAAATHPSAD